MRFERMVIEAGDNTFTLPLHPRLTMIAGVGRVERAAIVGELIGALASSRSGVHLEVVEDRGRRLAIFRPEEGQHRIVDVDSSTDVSREFQSASGRIDVLARHGLDVRTARRSLRLDQADLNASAHSNDLIRKLAEVDQTNLWSTAARVRVTDDELQKLADEVGSAPEDAAIIERIERRHLAVEAATGQHRKLRRHAVLVGVASCAIGVPVAIVNPLMAAPILTIGVLATLLALLYRVRVDSRAADEQKALSEAGAESYLGFQLQRVNGLLSDSEHRHRLMSVAEDHREAARRWTEVAGDVSVDWTLEHHEEIAAAAKLRRDMRTLGAMSSTAPELDDDATTDLAHALVSRLTMLRALGASGESFPLILDEPFEGLDGNVKPALLELLSRSAGNPQVVVLTDDEDVASWARLEALTGDLSVVEPAPEAETQNGQPLHAHHLAV